MAKRGRKPTPKPQKEILNELTGPPYIKDQSVDKNPNFPIFIPRICLPVFSIWVTVSSKVPSPPKLIIKSNSVILVLLYNLLYKNYNQLEYSPGCQRVDCPKWIEFIF